MLFKQARIPLLGSSYLGQEDRVEGAFASIKGGDPTCCQQLFLVENIHDGKLGMIIGTITFGLISQMTGMRNSVLALISFFVIGFLLLLLVPEKKED